MKIIFKWALILAVIGVIGLLFFFSFFYFQQEPNSLQELRAQGSVTLADLPTGTCNYELVGNPNDPLVVLVHGGSVTGLNVWNHNVEFLTSNRYQVLRFDLFGRGLSDFKSQLSLELYQKQLDELLLSLNIEKSFHLVGLSMGAMVVLEYAQKNPESINSLSLIAPAAMGLYKAHWTLKTPVINDFMVRAYWMPRAIDKQMSEFYEPEKHQEYARFIEKGTLINGFKAATLSIWLDVMSNDRIEALKDIGSNANFPVEAFFGEQDHLIPATLAERYQEAIPKVEVHVIDNSGHMPHYENPDQFNPLFLDFLERSYPTEQIDDEQ